MKSRDRETADVVMMAAESGRQRGPPRPTSCPVYSPERPDAGPDARERRSAGSRDIRRTNRRPAGGDEVAIMLRFGSTLLSEGSTDPHGTHGAWRLLQTK